MQTITTRIPDSVYKKLRAISDEFDRTKGYLVRKAVESYIDDIEDEDVAVQRIQAREKRITLEDIQKKYDLEG